MSLNLEQTIHIAHTSGLGLEEENIPALLCHLNSFLEFFEQMQVIDTSSTVPLVHPVEAVYPAILRMRDDIAIIQSDRVANQASAPATKAGLYIVPRVI